MRAYRAEWRDPCDNLASGKSHGRAVHARWPTGAFVCVSARAQYGNPPTEQIIRAIRLRRSLERIQSSIATVAVVHGYDAMSVDALRQVGWDVRDISHVDATAIMRQVPRESVGYHWPRYRSNVQTRQDNKCRAVHLLAWNLTEYDRIILSDLDLCVAADPLPWLRRHATANFVAFNEMAKLRGFRGINCHLALLRPSELVARVILDKARTASYIPYTRGAQDVIETVFPTQVTYDAWPAHVHAFKGVVDYDECDGLALKSGVHTESDRRLFHEIDARLLARERRLIKLLGGRG